MIKVKKFITNHRLAICLAIIHWFITTLFQLDRLFFQYETENKTMLVAKIVYFFSLLAIYCYCSVSYAKYKINPICFKKKIKIFLLSLSVLLILLLFLWPGDDIWILHNDQFYRLTPWQHILSGFWHILCLQFIPTPGGIILMQLIVAAACITYIVTKVQDIFFSSFEYKDLKKRTGFFLLPFFFPPVLMYLYSGYRIGLYIFLEAALLISLISLKYDKDCTVQKLISIAALTVVVASWRTEAFIYVLITSMAMLMMKNICQKEKVATVALVCIMFFGITFAQEKMLHSDNYKLMSTLRPLAELIKVADKDGDCDELASIDKVINLATVYKNPGANGETLYWVYHVVRNNYTKQEYRNYIKSIVNLSYKYPVVVFNERYRVLLASSSMHNNIAINNTYGARTLFYKNKLENMHDGSKQYFQKLQSPASKPVFMKMREKVIRLLGCMKSDFSLYSMYKVIWNHLIPTCFIMVFFIYQGCKKNYWICGILIGLILKWPIVFVTSPSGWFMYYLSFYLIGYMILVYSLLYYYLKFQHKGAETHES